MFHKHELFTPMKINKKRNNKKCVPIHVYVFQCMMYIHLFDLNNNIQHKMRFI